MAYVSLKRNFDQDYLQTSTSRSSKRRRCSPVRLSSAKFFKPSESSSSISKMTLNLTSEQTAISYDKEIKKCYQLFPDGNGSTDRSSSLTTLSSSEMNLIDPGWEEKPLFTYKQVLLICDNVLKENENEIRNEYDQALNAKLAEQHEKFVKFIYNKIQKRFENRIPSYLS